MQPQTFNPLNFKRDRLPDDLKDEFTRSLFARSPHEQEPPEASQEGQQQDKSQAAHALSESMDTELRVRMAQDRLLRNFQAF
jgi:hypothetical protein